MAESGGTTGTTGYDIRGSQGRVIEALGTAIVAGDHAPGDVLPVESTLMQEFDISRTTLREAIKVLAAKGLVESRQRIGTRVRPQEHWSAFDADVLRWTVAVGDGNELLEDFGEVRELLELASVRSAVERATDADFDRLAAVWRRMRAAVGNPVEYSRADAAFHTALFTASHNRALARLGLLVADMLQLSFQVQQATWRESHGVPDFSDDCAAHERLLAALRARKRMAAERAVRAIIADGRASLAATIRAVSA